MEEIAEKIVKDNRENRKYVLRGIKIRSELLQMERLLLKNNGVDLKQKVNAEENTVE